MQIKQLKKLRNKMVSELKEDKQCKEQLLQIVEGLTQYIKQIDPTWKEANEDKANG